LLRSTMSSPPPMNSPLMKAWVSVVAINWPIGGCLVVCCFQLIPWKKCETFGSWMKHLTLTLWNH
jgi:hypothetical protein